MKSSTELGAQPVKVPLFYRAPFSDIGRLLYSRALGGVCLIDFTRRLAIKRFPCHVTIFSLFRLDTYIGYIRDEC